MMNRILNGLALSLLIWSGGAFAQTADDIAGRVIGEADGRKVELPLLRADLEVNIEGDVATVRLTQVFENPSQTPMHAEYLFPLNQRAAVYAMEMRVGDEIVRAQIQKKAEAKTTFEAAKTEGKAAALLTQHRPNMFTQSVANLMPGAPVEVTLSYVQTVQRIDGEFELVVPLIVGPRYEGPPQLAALEEPVTEIDGWRVSDLPVYPQVAGLDLPKEIESDRVSLDLRLTSATPIVSMTSATHAISLMQNTAENGGTLRAAFADGRVIDNRDLVIRYALGGEDASAGVLAAFDGDGADPGGILSLMIEPPRTPDADQATPRELVFVLDTSGSMNGEPIAASKRFMASALAALRPGDYFRIIRFSNDATQFSAGAVPATQTNKSAGLRFVQGLQASGGTEIDNAIRTAFATRQPPETLRIVVFLSDGYIGDEAKVLRTIRGGIGGARIYAFGVGAAVNRYLLEEMADEGRGYVRYVDPTERASEAAEALAADLKTPLLTDISIDWGDLEVTDVSPARLPDLFAGNAIRVFARYQGGGPAEITVNGRARGRKASMPVKVDLPTRPAEDPESGRAIPLTWARERIADLERADAVGDGDPEATKRAITDLGLTYSLQTRHTSFVAVSERIVNANPDASKTANVPLPMVKGVKASAYPQAGFSGYSTPEPSAWLGILTMLAVGGVLSLRRRWRSA